MNKRFQSDLTEALARLNQTPLVLFPSDNDPNNEKVFRSIFIEMTGTYFILLAFIFKIKK
jgi:hypothetical protein